MTDFWLSFVSLFVAVNALGILPIFTGMTEGFDSTAKRSIILRSVAAATIVAVLFAAFGTRLLSAFGITVADFMVAGGILLFVISLTELVKVGKGPRKISPEELGAVPLGIPLIAGPAVLTTAMLQRELYGVWITIAAICANTLAAGLVFWMAEPINRVLGWSGAKIMSKIAHLLLAAIAVMLVRKGVTSFLGG